MVVLGTLRYMKSDPLTSNFVRYMIFFNYLLSCSIALYLKSNASQINESKLTKSRKHSQQMKALAAAIVKSILK